MASAQWRNHAETTLSVAITALSTTWTVDDGSVFPAPAGPPQYWWATVQSGSVREIVRVTARVGDTLTVQRGQQGTTPAAFAASSTVYLAWTAEDAEQSRSDAVPSPVYTGGRAVLWDHATAGTFGSTGLVSDRVYATLHREEQRLQTYDAVIVGVSFPGAGALCGVALYAYDETLRRVTDRLWSASGIDCSVAGERVQTFAGGVWDPAGAPYRTGADELRLPKSLCVVKAIQWNGVGGITVHAIPVGECRAWLPHDEAGLYSGAQRPSVLWDGSSAYPATPAVWADPPGTDVIQVPAIALRRAP